MSDYSEMAKYALDVRDYVHPNRVDFVLHPTVDPERLKRAIADEAIDRAIRRTEPR